jgi:hypothetical protein
LIDTGVIANPAHEANLSYRIGTRETLLPALFAQASGDAQALQQRPASAPAEATNKNILLRVVLWVNVFMDTKKPTESWALMLLLAGQKVCQHKPSLPV